MYSDPQGTTRWWEWLILGAAVAVIAAATIVATVATGGAIFAAAAIIALGGMGAMVGNFISQGVSKGFDNIDVGELGIRTLFGSMYGLACTVSGVGALFAKAGVSAIESMTMTLYQSDGEASFGEVMTSGVQGFVFSIILQKAAGCLMDKLNYGGTTPLWGNAVKPESIALMAGGISFLRKFSDFVMPTILGQIKKSQWLIWGQIKK